MENKRGPVPRAAAGKAGAAAFGARIKGLRQSSGWTQADLADQMSEAGYPMHQTTVAKIENATRPTTIEEAMVLASLFRIDVSTLLTVSDERMEIAGQIAHQKARISSLGAHVGRLKEQQNELWREMSKARQYVEEAETRLEELSRGEHHETA